MSRRSPDGMDAHESSIIAEQEDLIRKLSHKVYNQRQQLRALHRKWSTVRFAMHLNAMHTSCMFERSHAVGAAIGEACGWESKGKN